MNKIGDCLHLRNTVGFCRPSHICDCLSENPHSFALASISRNTILKIQLKITSLALVVRHSLSIIILSYPLAIVQLTRQVDNAWFSPVFFYDFF